MPDDIEKSSDFAQYTLYTNIQTSYKTAQLIRGTFFAVLGLFLMILASVEWSPEILSNGGIFVFLFGVGLIAFGLLPYRKLLRLELKPDHLIVTDTHVIYKQKQIAIDEIERVTYYENYSDYGISIHKKKGQQIELPFFTRRSEERLREYIFNGRED